MIKEVQLLEAPPLRHKQGHQITSTQEIVLQEGQVLLPACEDTATGAKAATVLGAVTCHHGLGLAAAGKLVAGAMAEDADGSASI